MPSPPPERRAAFRDAIERFLKERLDAKIEKLAPDDPKRDALTAQYSFHTWLEDAVRRVAQIQAVTHTLKPIHPDARGTNLFRSPGSLGAHTEVGSQSLPADFSIDVVGNAAALDVYKLLKVPIYDRTLLDWMQDGDPDLTAALNADSAEAQGWIEAFTGITRPRSGAPSSHTLGKQVYWLTGDDPCDDGQYNLLAPLFASSLAQSVFQTIDEDRFGETGKIARQAKREGRDHDTGYREYPNLAIQKFGGTKPQNISQLNSERRGNNYLLASIPPKWKTRPMQTPWHVDSVFSFFGRRDGVRKALRELRAFLQSDPPSTMETRNTRDAWLDTLIDELVDFAHPLQNTLPPGWTRDPDCRLAEAEMLWLDPGRAAANEADDAEFCAAWQHMDWPAEIGKRFGNWLNAQLGQQLPLGDIEGRQWRDELLLHEGWAGTLHRQRGQATAPAYIPVREATQ